MVARVRPADSGGVEASLTSGFKYVCADPSSGGRVASHGLEVKS